MAIATVSTMNIILLAPFCIDSLSNCFRLQLKREKIYRFSFFILLIEKAEHVLNVHLNLDFVSLNLDYSGTHRHLPCGNFLPQRHPQSRLHTEFLFLYSCYNPDACDQRSQNLVAFGDPYRDNHRQRTVRQPERSKPGCQLPHFHKKQFRVNTPREE